MVMQPGWTEEIRIPMKMGSEKEAMDRASSFARAIGFGAERIEDIKTALSEACLNAIEHASAKDASDAVVATFLRDEHGMQVTVVNKGKSFSPAEGKPDIKAKIEGRDRVRGWGLFLMRELADEVDIKHEAGSTMLTLKFHL
jgi:serine/threonine-protein kinase RsbW